MTDHRPDVQQDIAERSGPSSNEHGYISEPPGPVGAGPALVPAALADARAAGRGDRADRDLAATTRDQLTAVVHVYKAPGGGWRGPLPARPEE